MSISPNELESLVERFSKTPYYTPMTHRDEEEVMGEAYGNALAAVFAFKKAAEHLTAADKREVAKWLEDRWIAMNSDEYRAAQKGHSTLQRDVASGACGKLAGLVDWLVKQVDSQTQEVRRAPRPDTGTPACSRHPPPHSGGRKDVEP